MGKDSVGQKERFIGLNKGPKSRNDVLTQDLQMKQLVLHKVAVLL